MAKNKLKLPIIIISTLLLISIIFNIVIYNIYDNNKNDELIIKCIPTKNEIYDAKEEYYNKIPTKKFKKILATDETLTIAVVDNSSPTSQKFIELINKIAFYKNTNIYLLEVSKLSKKNEVYFYELDERLKSLNSDYIITIKEEKVISITELNKEDINLLIESIK